MFFLFLLLAILGGAIAGRAVADGDGGLVFIGLVIIVIASIANGFVGFPT